MPSSDVGAPTASVSLAVSLDTVVCRGYMLTALPDPRWAAPIKNIVRQTAQARAVAQVLAARSPPPAADPPPLRVVNAPSSVSATLSHASTASPVDGLPSLAVSRPLPAPPRAPITPSLPTLEKAVSARIYFENIYYALLRGPSSRDQRRVALERELARLPWSDHQKVRLRERWRTNETEYLRDRRRRVGPNAFVKLKTIGHGAFGVVSLVREVHSGQLYAMKQVSPAQHCLRFRSRPASSARPTCSARARRATYGPSGTSSSLQQTRTGSCACFTAFKTATTSTSCVPRVSRIVYSSVTQVLEYMGGGDLLNLLIERDVFEEDFARFYIAEVRVLSLFVLRSPLP